MGLSSRKIYIWLISLAVLLAIYLLYSQVSKTPRITVDTEPQSGGVPVDGNLTEFPRSTGKIGDVGVGAVRNARYVRLNDEKQIEREFGFEKLLHEEGDEWEIEKPYMNIYRPSFKCYITADKGKVQIEDTVGSPSPRNATLSGNVVIHIVPEGSGSIKESFIYLDDVAFTGDKSQFSTAGPVKFVSQDAQMLGRGLELVYNNELDCLEFLRIVHLESLRLKTTSQVSLFASGQSGRRMQKPHEPAATAELLTAKPMFAANSALGNSAVNGKTQKAEDKTDKQADEQKKKQYYRCVFSENVLIDCPQQVILADKLSINNILLSKASNDKPEKTDTPPKSEISQEAAPAKEVKADTAGADTGGTGNTPADTNKPDELTDESTDIVVTCDNGIIVMPMDSPEVPENNTAPGGIKSFEDSNGRPTFVAQKIDYCAVTKDTVATGPSELTFYAKGITGNQAKKTPAVVKVTAQTQAKFLPASNQAIFEGKCLSTMLAEDANCQLKYTLSAPKLIVNLTRDKESDSPRPSARGRGSSLDIEHLTADGGTVRLATLKTKAEELLGGIELKCSRFDYDTSRQTFLAAGPGLIKADNSNIPQPKVKAGKFSLQQQCYAVIQNFDTLNYSLQTNQIIADAEQEAVLINYFPVSRGQYGQQVAVTSKHIEALLYEIADGQTELSTLRATGGFTYEEESDKTKKTGQVKEIQFVGSEMFYDAGKSIMKVQGDKLQPCYFNGALVDGIEYNLKTDRIKTRITAPGVLPLNLH